MLRKLTIHTISAGTFYSALFCHQSIAIELFVSTIGHDEQAGTIEAPLRTIERAVGFSQSLADSEPLTINIREGRYFAAKTIEIHNSDRMIVVQAYEHENVTISGGVTLNIGNALRVDNSALPTEFPANTRNSIFTIPLPIEFRKPGNRFHWTRAKPGQEFLDPASSPEMIIDGTRLQISRWPNGGWAKVADSRIERSAVTNSERVHISVFTDGRQVDRGWGSDIWIRGYWNVDWYDEAIPARPLSDTPDSFELIDKTQYEVTRGSRVVVLNSPLALDEPGEYYIDYDENIIYY